MLTQTETQPFAKMMPLIQESPVSMGQIQEFFFRDAPAWVKLELMDDQIRTTLELIEAGVRLRHPESSPEMIRRHMADVILGAEIAKKVFGRIQ